MISVIVPVYNVERYLDKCVQSILVQTYKDFELILVDDGSPDNCPQMCDYYAKKDKRVRVIHKENGGLSDARNAGTAIAIGDYVTYIDSDDFVSREYLHTLWSLKEKYTSDITVVGMCLVKENEKPIIKAIKKEYCYSGEEALEKMLYQNTLDTSACAILLPIELAKRTLFPYGKYHEDEFTTYKYYANSNRVVVTTEKHYFYLQRAGSIMHNFGKANMDELDAADNLVFFCKENYPHLVKAAESKKFSDYCQVLLASKNLKKYYLNVYQRIKIYLNKKKYQILFDKETRTKNKVAAVFVIIGNIDLLSIMHDLRNVLKIINVLV